MPIYEYQCETCEKVFEVYQRHSDPPPASHDCGSTRVRRVLSNTSFILKGTGWYATDYATPAKSEAKEASDGGDRKASPEKVQGQAKQDGPSSTSAPAAAGAGTSARGGDAGGSKGGDAGGGSSQSAQASGGGNKGGSSSGGSSKGSASSQGGGSKGSAGSQGSGGAAAG